MKFRVRSFDWGSDYYKKHGVMMPADGLAELKKFDAIFFGAVGAPDIPAETVQKVTCANMTLFGQVLSLKEMERKLQA